MEDNINTKNKEERDWEKTGIKVLDMAKQELFLGMRYMFLALNMLGYKAGQAYQVCGDRRQLPLL